MKKENKENTPSTANLEKPSESVADSAQTTDGAGDDTSNQGTERERILIKLKYLNDTLKEVDGSLDELLKDFKW